MALLFKISRDGSFVYVLKGASKKDLEENEFMKKASKVSIESFIEYLPDAQKEKIKQVTSMLSKIHMKRVGEIWSTRSEFDSVNNSVNFYYTIAGRNFTYVKGGDYGCGGDKYTDIVKYATTFFGKEFMERHIDELNEEGVHYYADGEEISVDEFREYQHQVRSLTQITVMDKKIEKYVDDKVKQEKKKMKKSEGKKH